MKFDEFINNHPWMMPVTIVTLYIVASVLSDLIFKEVL